MEDEVTEYTEKEIEQMRAVVAAADAKRAAEAAAAYEELMRPIRELVTSEAFREVASKLAENEARYVEVDNVGVHISALALIMPRLTGAVGFASAIPSAQDQDNATS